MPSEWCMRDTFRIGYPLAALANFPLLEHLLIPHLSCWDESTDGIHERGEFTEPVVQLWQRDEIEPGEQETGADKGLEHEPEIDELGFPALAVIPLRMRLDRSRWWFGRFGLRSGASVTPVPVSR